MSLFDRLLAQAEPSERGLKPRIKSAYESAPEEPEMEPAETLAQTRSARETRISAPMPLNISSIEEHAIFSEVRVPEIREINSEPVIRREEISVAAEQINLPAEREIVEVVMAEREVTPPEVHWITERAVEEIREFETRETTRHRFDGYRIGFDELPLGASAPMREIASLAEALEAEPPAPTVEIKIGRIDVRFDSPASTPAPRPRGQLKVSLEDHLKVRNGGNG